MAFMDPLDLVVVMMQVLMCQDLGIHLWYLKVLVLSTPTTAMVETPTRFGAWIYQRFRA
jgi:hypothetical protein